MSKTLRCGCTPHEGAELHNIPGCPVIQAHAYRDTLRKTELALEELQMQFDAVISIVEKCVGALSLALPDEEE